MKIYKVYKVEYCGGMDGRAIENVYYTTKEGAENFIKNDNWGWGHELIEIEVAVTSEGKIVRVF